MSTSSPSHLHLPRVTCLLHRTPSRLSHARLVSFLQRHRSSPRRPIADPPPHQLIAIADKSPPHPLPRTLTPGAVGINLPPATVSIFTATATPKSKSRPRISLMDSSLRTIVCHAVSLRRDRPRDIFCAF
jgi:hypothetical protein